MNEFPKGFLFDFDGVIVNSKSTHFAAWASAYKELFNGEICPFPDHLEGCHPQKIAAYFAQNAGDTERGNTLHNLKLEHLLLIQQDNILLPGVHEITQLLQEKNIAYGIASNASRGFVENTIKQQDILFNVFTGNEDYSYPKPHPEAYISLAKKLGFTKEDFSKLWVFEDSLAGLQAAVEAGMYPVGIATKLSIEVLIEKGAAMAFNDLLDAYTFLKDLN